MDLKQKLLVNFIAIILVALVVFGLNAYQIASDSTRDAEKRLLDISVQIKSQLLAAELREHPSLEYLESYLDVSNEGRQHVLFLTDHHGRIVAPSRVSAAGETADFPFARILAQPPETSQLSLADKDFLWSRAAVAGSPYQLFHVFRSGEEANGTLGKLASRLAVAGLIVVWVAVWVALIISTAVSRRLNAQTDALAHQATHDSLTGLPNRMLLHERMEQAIQAAGQTGKSVFLVMMDLNGFKEINDTLGHHTGDALLQVVGGRLQQILSEPNLAARIGGDEFALLLPAADVSYCAQIVQKVLNAITQPVSVEAMTLEVDLSLGIARYPNDSKTAEELAQHADVAMYLAKRSGESYMRYDAARDPHSLERLTLMADLRHAAERGELSLHYQPKMDIARQHVIGAEALLRWYHPRLGPIAPDDFIPQAEQSGIIKPLTYWILDSAIQQCAEWNAAGMPITVSVNLSARVTQDIRLPAEVATTLKRHGVNADQLELEITETAIMLDPVHAMEVLTRLDVMGVRLSLDDFGTGYTSLAYLKRLPVDEVKIDKSFVMNMLRDANDAMIVHAIIDLAHNLQRSVAAEGVENRKILEALRALGCDTAQGYYFSKPLPAADFEAWWRSVLGPATPFPGPANRTTRQSA
jgi:diguanylate cyclase (GGDEF)-like protein